MRSASRFTLSELLNDADNLVENFKAYIDGFSQNVKDILDGGGLKIEGEIDKMDKGGCLYAIVKQYSEMDLSEQTVPSVLMGHIFENLIRRSFVEEGQGEDFTARSPTTSPMPSARRRCSSSTGTPQTSCTRTLSSTTAFPM